MPIAKRKLAMVTHAHCEKENGNCETKNGLVIDSEWQKPRHQSKHNELQECKCASCYSPQYPQGEHQSHIKWRPQLYQLCRGHAISAEFVIVFNIALTGIIFFVDNIFTEGRPVPRSPYLYWFAYLACRVLGIKLRIMWGFFPYTSDKAGFLWWHYGTPAEICLKTTG